MPVGRTKKSTAPKKRPSSLPKSPTGIKGLDEITFGGLPKGRPTLIAGGPGCGKTIFGLEFLSRGVSEFNEPGVFVTFEENPKDLTQNVNSLGFNLKKLIDEKKLIIDHIKIQRGEIEETGAYDLEGLFVRLEESLNEVKAKRVVLDTIESLFSSFSNEAIIRSEIRRLFDFLKDKGLTAIITGERGDGRLTRYGLEEYISDCVIFLDHRVKEQISTRRLRIIKYRGSTHGTNEYPFLIDEDGITVMPITSLQLDYKISNRKVNTGITTLDALLGKKGFYKGSTILYSGQAGSGKTSFAASFANAACERGEKCLYFAFEESENSIVRNMESIGINLKKHIQKGLLNLHASRPNIYGLEQHLFTMNKLIQDFEPSVVNIDPITSLSTISETNDSSVMFIRLIDFLKQKRITLMLTALTSSKNQYESGTEISSLIDAWVVLKKKKIKDNYQNSVRILKVRGMDHSNHIHSFSFTNDGVVIGEPLNEDLNKPGKFPKKLITA